MSQSSPSIKVLYFAAASTATEMTEEVIPIPIDGLPLLSLSKLISSLHPSTSIEAILATAQWSVDAEMVEDPKEVTLKGGEEVAVICPVSGG
jgi:molybdopterin synthase sulfur carrier subunit